MRAVIVVLALALASMARPALAQDSTEFAVINGWSLFDERGTCSATTIYEGSIIVRVTYDFGSNTAWLIVANPAWESVEDGRRYSVSLYFSNGEEYPDAWAYGLRIDHEDGRITALRMQLMGDEFMSDFANAGGVALRMGETRLAILSLRGTRAVAQRLSRCAADGFRRYPPDPFRSTTRQSSSTTAPSAGSANPQPRTNLASYVSNDDYPASALRAGEEGRTSFRLTVGPSGRVLDCAVTISSGSLALDNATCRIMRSRARFTPARDASGSPITGTAESSINWRIVDPAPPPTPE